MTQEETFVKEGAWFHCARLIYKNQDVGLRGDDGVVVLTDIGKEIYAKLADITDVVVKPARKAKATAEISIEDIQP